MRKMFTFRLNADLVDKVRAIAVKENRTLTNQIETELFKLVEDYEKDNDKRTLGQSAQGRTGIPQ